MPWSILDRVLAAALPLAVKRSSDGADLRLFEVGTLVDALVDLKEAPGPLYKFLNLLAVGNGVADDVRDKLAAIGLDEGTYTVATEAQMKTPLRKARKAASEADKKKRKAKAEPSPKRTRRGPLSGN